MDSCGRLYQTSTRFNHVVRHIVEAVALDVKQQNGYVTVQSWTLLNGLGLHYCIQSLWQPNLEFLSEQLLLHH